MMRTLTNSSTYQKLSVFSMIVAFMITTTALHVQGMDYYVGGTRASDSNPGTAIQPFATIQKAASVAVFGDGVNAAIYWDMGSGPSTVDHNVCWNNFGNDIFTNVCHQRSGVPVSYYYNNVFASKYTFYAQSYKSPCRTPVDVQRNNIYRDEIMVDQFRVTANVANSLLENVDPQFAGTGEGGLAYRI